MFTIVNIMISYLKGQLMSKNPPTLILENNGIGYALEASMQTFYQLPEVSQEVLLYTLLLIKEDKQWLYGFMHTGERQLFQELLKINTIGAKVALAILSNMDVASLHQVVSRQDVRALQHIPGIGRKTAERLLLELTNRVGHWKLTPAMGKNVHNNAHDDDAKTYTTQQDAISALIALGYKPQIAAQAVQTILSTCTTAPVRLEQLIRLALQQLGQSNR
jgi:holliday junction DNA helicase RuvA